ncbi:hypothetical protein [[Mycoplasma] testudinis]|uniref:hypothetical protein n=1 Tax=[Mycoplasma] testudinis TaxID=33924 RepID=UPI000A8A43FD|nr:hypothetical protein [[Mycoplasma] testudinis]
MKDKKIFPKIVSLEIFLKNVTPFNTKEYAKSCDLANIEPLRQDFVKILKALAKT